MLTVQAIAVGVSSTVTAVCWSECVARHAARTGQKWDATPLRLKLRWSLLSLTVGLLSAAFGCLLAASLGWDH